MIRRPQPPALAACSAALLIAGCSAQFFGSAWSSKPAAVEKIRVGDTMDAVAKKLGQPKSTVEQITEQGHRRVEWRFPAFAKFNRSLTGSLEPLSSEPVSVKSQATESGSGSEIVVIFEDEKVLFAFERQR